MQIPSMRFTDTSRGRPFAKDPAVARLGDDYFLYYSVPPYGDGRESDGWSIGIATSRDLNQWHKVGELLPAEGVEAKGICAPGVLAREGTVHLFYQTYGNGPRDAICHAVSTDGLTFRRDPSNPIFRPTGDWNCGRAIDADVIAWDDRLLLFYATRDPNFRVQMLGVAAAPLASDFSRTTWTQLGNEPILQPELAWEQECIEAPALCIWEGRLVMFYAGAYNNAPQQVGVAVSGDGVAWTRLWDEPFLPNGQPGEWNSSESGHPFLFTDSDGTTHLFFQGNNDGGKSWCLSRHRVEWSGGEPLLGVS
ncbi:MAG: family 43 glycosylhydrolase [Caldilineaceae bacterium]|nr:family 43 glycosylhydrolase [Caldilineaceae bacterium]HRJ40989.1 family 43 glycosylhydrolase [Caldilineaceae bacterium]